MSAQVVARILGVGFFVAGILGFIPPVAPHAPRDAQFINLDAAYGMLFGLFPVNAAHNVLHLIVGAWGIIASRAFRSGVGFARALTWMYGALVVLGVIPITSTLFGAVPVYGHDVWLDALVTLIAAYGGYGAGSRAQQPAIDARA
jgi:hypothetical protein